MALTPTHTHKRARTCIRAHTCTHMHRILIDLDASCVIGARSGFKVTSSAFFPPEIAQFEFEKASGQATMEIIASEKLDMWHLGLMLLQVRKYNSMIPGLTITRTLA